MIVERQSGYFSHFNQSRNNIMHPVTYLLDTANNLSLSNQCFLAPHWLPQKVEVSKKVVLLIIEEAHSVLTKICTHIHTGSRDAVTLFSMVDKPAAEVFAWSKGY